jgi:hypothetical protein
MRLVQLRAEREAPFSPEARQYWASADDAGVDAFDPMLDRIDSD